MVDIKLCLVVLGHGLSVAGMYFQDCPQTHLINVDKCWLLRAVPEIILGGGGDGPQILFCPVGGGCFVDNVSEGWGVGR